MPETASVREILLAIHEQSQVENELEIAQGLRQLSQSKTQSNGFSNLLGCVGGIAIITTLFLFLGSMFGLGEKLFSRPIQVLEKGQIVTLELVNASDATPYIGKPCRILANHLEIETPEGIVLIPNEQYRKVLLRLDK